MGTCMSHMCIANMCTHMCTSTQHTTRMSHMCTARMTTHLHVGRPLSELLIFFSQCVFGSENLLGNGQPRRQGKVMAKPVKGYAK